MPHLLIVSHSPSARTRQLTEAVLKGACQPMFDSVDTKLTEPLKTGPEDVRRADAVILGTTENFGYMSGAMKDFFDRIYYPCLEHTEGLPWALWVRAGNDGQGARGSIERIVTGLKWRNVQEPLICAGSWQDVFPEQAEELGATIAAGLDAGLF